MRVVLSGAEKGSYRSVLLANGVKRMALNLTQFSIPKRKELALAEMFPGVELTLWTSEGDEDVDRFDEFVRHHLDSLTNIIGIGGYDGTWMGSKYIPMWSDSDDMERLAYLCSKHGSVAIPDKAMTAKTLPRIRQLHQRWGTKMIGITSKPDMIEAIDWDSVIVSSWTSVVRYGETQVWDGHGLRRYPAQQKDTARRKHRSDIMRLGCDMDLIMDDDVSEVSKLAIRSWLEWEMSTFGTRAYDPLEDDDETEVEGGEMGGIVATPPLNVGKPNADKSGLSIATTAPERRHESEKSLLPVMGIERIIPDGSFRSGTQGEEIEIDHTETPVVRYQSSGLRQCDSCYLAPRCPAFKPHAECAYELPIELRTKDQLNALLTAMLEMQASRVMFARFAEELEGQGMDPALSSEMDRLFQLVDKFKNISDSRDLVRFEMEARSGAGVLSRLFGAAAGEQSRAVSTPMSIKEIDQAIIDADVLSDNDNS
jgi:hypothetical protein